MRRGGATEVGVDGFRDRGTPLRAHGKVSVAEWTWRTMRHGQTGLRIALFAGTSLFLAWVPSALGQATPVSGSPAPEAAAPPVDSPTQVAERLRRMEQTNQDLLQQVRGMSRQIDDLTKRLEVSERTLKDTQTKIVNGISRTESRE